MFRIALPSNASLEYFPKNTASNYTVKPAIPLSLSNYEVALSEIIFPNSWQNVRKGYNTVTISRLRKKKGDEDAVKAKLTIPPGYYTSIEKLIEVINKEKLNKFQFVTITYNDINKSVTVSTEKQYDIQFGDDIARLLGFNPGEIIGGDRIENVHTKGHFNATTSGGFNAIYIYTDIVVDQFVGGQTAPLLRIVDVNQQQNDDYTSRTFKKEYFIPLKDPTLTLLI